MDNQELEQELELEILETDMGTFTENKTLRFTAQEVYEKELKRREQIDICPEPTIQQEVESLKEQVLELSDIIILMSQQ